MAVLSRIYVNENKVESLLFVNDYPDYEMCCFKRKMSAPKRLIDSKAWCPLSFLLEILSP